MMAQLVGFSQNRIVIELLDSKVQAYS